MRLSLEECLQTLTRFAERSYLGVEAELVGINNLRENREIKKFVGAYQEHLKQKLSQLKEKRIKGSRIRRLLGAGYSMDEVTEFYTFDCFYFTLGHITNQNALRLWYHALDQKWPDKKKGCFSNMYRDAKASH